MEFAEEHYSSVLVAEINPLLQAHADEISHFKDIKLEPEWGTYETIAKNGMLRIFTVREAGELVGYTIFFVRRNPHYASSTQATNDIIFIKKELRRGGAGMRLIKFADERLALSGVQVVSYHVKDSHNFGPLLGRIGYEMIEHLWAKRLDR